MREHIACVSSRASMPATPPGGTAMGGARDGGKGKKPSWRRFARNKMDRRPQAAETPQSEQPAEARLADDLQARETELAQLLRNFRLLERRVQTLEERLNGHSPRAAQALPRPAPRAQTPHSSAATAIPVFGGAFLALAGAYLLRALSEYKLIPLTYGVAAGIVYAALWLFLAARAGRTRPLAAAVRGCTSALILMPLLWEATLEFGALSHWKAAGIIAAYLCLGLALSWRNRLAVTAWTSTLAAIVSAVALLVATHDLVPFALAVLLAAALMEAAACLGRWPGERWAVAVTADVVVLFLASIAGREGGVPEAYVPIPAAVAIAIQIALPAIYLSSTTLRTLALGLELTIAEIIQIAVVLLLSFAGVLQIGHGSQLAAKLVGVFCLGCGALFYGFALRSRRLAGSGRNFHAYSWLGLLLIVTGSVLRFSGAWRAGLICGLSLLTLLLARWTREASLAWHGSAYLLLAAAFSGLGTWAGANLLGGGQGWSAPAPGAAITAAAAVFAYALAWKNAPAEHAGPAASVPALAMAGLASWAAAGLMAGALAGGSGAAPVLGASLRTFILTAMALALAFHGTKWRRRELVWLMYPFMALAAFKVVVQDLAHGQTISLFVSLFLYGGALILLPRILQKASRTSSLQ